MLALSTDCGDAGNLAAFWAAAPGRTVDPAAVPRSAAAAPGNSGAAGPQLIASLLDRYDTGNQPAPHGCVRDPIPTVAVEVYL
jgi:hypothetical protein